MPDEIVFLSTFDAVTRGAATGITREGVGVVADRATWRGVNTRSEYTHAA
jgi:hypothetical protein